MQAADLQEAVQRFLEQGGQITQVEQRQHHQDAPELIAALRQHRHITEAAKALQISTRRVIRLARRHGITFESNNSGLARAARQPAEAAIVPRLRRLAGTMGREKLAATLGITVGPLRRIAREHNINLNSRSPA